MAKKRAVAETVIPIRVGDLTQPQDEMTATRTCEFLGISKILLKALVKNTGITGRRISNVRLFRPHEIMQLAIALVDHNPARTPGVAKPHPPDSKRRARKKSALAS